MYSHYARAMPKIERGSPVCPDPTLPVCSQSVLTLREGEKERGGEGEGERRGGRVGEGEGEKRRAKELLVGAPRSLFLLNIPLPKRLAYELPRKTSRTLHVKEVYLTGSTGRTLQPETSVDSDIRNLWQVSYEYFPYAPSVPHQQAPTDLQHACESDDDDEEYLPPTCESLQPTRESDDNDERDLLPTCESADDDDDGDVLPTCESTDDNDRDLLPTSEPTDDDNNRDLLPIRKSADDDPRTQTPTEPYTSDGASYYEADSANAPVTFDHLFPPYVDTPITMERRTPRINRTSPLYYEQKIRAYASELGIFIPCAMCDATLDCAPELLLSSAAVELFEQSLLSAEVRGRRKRKRWKCAGGRWKHE